MLDMKFAQINVTYCNKLVPVGMIRGLKLGLKWYGNDRSEEFVRFFHIVDAAATAAPLVAIFCSLQWNLILRFFCPFFFFFCYVVVF